MSDFVFMTIFHLAPYGTTAEMRNLDIWKDKEKEIIDF